MSSYSQFFNNYEILIEDSDHDYQGDIRYLLRNGTSYGFSIVGFGSCSYCDAEQRCESDAEREDLKRNLLDDIKWFYSLDKLKKYILEPDAERIDGHYVFSNNWSEFKVLLKGLK